jgi:hypothetical protein
MIYNSKVLKMFFSFNKMNIYHIVIIALLVYIIYRLEKRHTGACPCSTYMNNDRQYFDPQSNLPQKNSPYAEGSFYMGVPYYSVDQLQKTRELPRNMDLTYSTYGYPYIPEQVPYYNRFNPHQG